jgi:hypothetical protein
VSRETLEAILAGWLVGAIATGWALSRWFSYDRQMLEYTAEEQERAQLMAAEIRAMGDRAPQTFRLEATVFDLFRIVGTLQLAWRHPGLDDRQREVIERFARQLQEQMTTPETPEIARTLEQGWHREYDR